MNPAALTAAALTPADPAPAAGSVIGTESQQLWSDGSLEFFA
jgi:hypothetical protein